MSPPCTGFAARRNRSAARTGVPSAVLAGLLLCIELACGTPPTPSTPAPAAADFQPAACRLADALPLDPRQPPAGTLAAGEHRCFTIDLPPGAYLQLASSQGPDFDLVWTVYDATGDELPPFDLVADGPELLDWIQPLRPAGSAPDTLDGAPGLLVRLHEFRGQPGRYTLTASVTLQPTAGQRAIAQAARDFAAASADAEPTLQSLRPVIDLAATAEAPRTEAALVYRYTDLVREVDGPDPERDAEIARIARHLIALQDAHGTPARQLRSRVWAAQALGHRDELRNAESWLDEALALALEEADLDMEGNVRALRAQLYLLREEPGRAERELDDAKRAFSAAGRPLAAAQVLLNLARPQAQYGAGDLVRALLGRAESLLRDAPRDEDAVWRRKLECDLSETRGDLARFQRDLDDAEAHYRRGLALAEAYDLDEEHAAAVDGLGRTAMVRDDPAVRRQATELLAQSWREWRTLGNTTRARSARLQLAHAHYRAGQIAEAAGIFEEICPAADPDPAGEELLSFASCHLGLGRIARDRGELADALDQMLRGLALFESYRDGADRVDQRGRLAASGQYYYEEPINIALRLDERTRQARARASDDRHPSDDGAAYRRLAFALSEQSRARWLRDSLLLHLHQEAGPEGGATAVAPPTGAAAASRDPGAEAQRRATADALYAAARRHERALAGTNEELERAIAEQSDAIYDFLLSRQPLDLDAAGDLADTLPFLEFDAARQRAAANSALLLQYDLGRDRGHLWAIGADGVEVHSLPGQREIGELLERHRKEIEQSSWPRSEEATRRALSESASLLLAPVAHRLDGRSLWIVASGQLDGFPFAALPLPPGAPAATATANADATKNAAAVPEVPDDPFGPPLGLSHPILRPPSISAIGWLTDRAAARGTPDTGEEIALLADPVYQNDDRCPPGPAGSSDADIAAGQDFLRFPRLAQSAAEAHTLSAMVPTGSALESDGREADRALVLSGRLAGFRRLHFATHAVTVERSPELSSLVLSRCDDAGRPEDPYLYAYEIADLELRAELATLSGCDTGLGHFLPGEGFLGLPHAFFQAGVPRTLVSLWKVSDASAPLFMEHFYRALLHEGATPAEALQSAQRAFHDHPDFYAPYYWAGYTLRGIP